METTLTLRKRLGFNEVTEWKQFCSRRLHLIHTLSLNLRKASEQDEQVRVLAAELCAEYGFSSAAQADFEKLLIAGIQSVRRNQKRSSRNPNGANYQNGILLDKVGKDINGSYHTEDQMSKSVYASPPASVASSSSGSFLSRAPSHLQPLNTRNNTQDSVSAPTLPMNYHKPVSVSSSGLQYEQTNLAHIAGGHTKFAHAPSSIVEHHEVPMTQSLILRLEVLRGMIKAASATWIELSAPVVAHMSAKGVLSAAVAASVVHSKLSNAQFENICGSVTQGPLLEALRLAIDPRFTTVRLLERIGALAASLVHGPNLLSGLQALFVSLVQAAQGSLEDMRSILKSMALKETEPDQSNQPECAHSDTSRSSQGSIHSSVASHQETAISAPPPTANSSSHHSSTPYYQPTIMIAPPPPIHMHMVPHGMYVEQQMPAPHPNTSFPASSINSISNSNGVPPPATNGNISHQVNANPQNSSESPISSASVSTSSSSTSQTSLPDPGPDRLVTIQFDDRVLKMTYSPMKATPPTISEIIDNARKSFSIPSSTVVRVRYVQRNKIIETNAELIDALTQRQVNLELLIPPPMLMGVPRGDGKARFTSLAPIFRTSL